MRIVLKSASIFEAGQELEILKYQAARERSWQGKLAQTMSPWGMELPVTCSMEPRWKWPGPWLAV